MTEIATRAPRSAMAWPSLLELLRVSRIGLIVSHLWVFLLPLAFAGGGGAWSAQAGSWSFWISLVYVTVPLGLLIYGWNDFFDWDVDHASVRKNHAVTAAVFGPSLRPHKLASLPYVILAAQLPFAVYWAVTGQPLLLGWLALMALGNALYNGPGLRLSRIPILAELTATGIYLLIGLLGVLVHDAPMSGWLWLFATLSILNFQIMGTLVDMEDDARVGKRTLSVAFGRTTSQVAVLLSLLAKAALTYVFTGHLLATAVMLGGFVLVAAGLSLPRWRPSSTAYSSFIFLDWIWLALMFLV